MRAVLAAYGLTLVALLAAAGSDGADVRLPPTDGLRRWVKLLDGEFADGELPEDELPSVVLPERLAAQVPSRSLTDIVHAAASEVDVEVAIAADRAAALHGLTLESWALRTALAAPSR